VDAQLLILVEPDKPLTDYLAQMQALGVPADSLTIRGDLDRALIGQIVPRLRHVDAVHTHLIHADVHGLLAGMQAGVRLHFCSGHNDDQFRHKLHYRLAHALFWRRVTAGIAISEAVRQFMINVEFAPPQKIHTVHYGFDPTTAPVIPDLYRSLRAELGLAPDTPIVGSVCRLIEQKGLPHALAAFAQIREQTAAHYVIIGDGPLRDSLAAQAHALGLADRVHFLGWKPDARAYYAAFNCFLMPSLWEGFGLVVLEAMAARLPVVASAISALPEIVRDGETGYLVPPSDPSRIAARLLDLLRDPDHARRLGEQGRQRLDSAFSVSQMVAGTMAVYGAVYGQGR
jgi:glycosyltransferase involved in cell wall biosynthesis